MAKEPKLSVVFLPPTTIGDEVRYEDTFNAARDLGLPAKPCRCCDQDVPASELKRKVDSTLKGYAKIGLKGGVVPELRQDEQGYIFDSLYTDETVGRLEFPTNSDEITENRRRGIIGVFSRRK